MLVVIAHMLHPFVLVQSSQGVQSLSHIDQNSSVYVRYLHNKQQCLYQMIPICAPPVINLSVLDSGTILNSQPYQSPLLGAVKSNLTGTFQPKP